jgi:glycerol-3-phosphate acyltransferase PlsX
VVSDGFSGNVALKTMEGLATVIGTFLKEEFSAGAVRRLQGLMALPALNAIRARLDYRRYNGASLVGLNGIVIKSHGAADALAFEMAINTAIVEARKGVPVQIGQLIEDEASQCIRA